MWLGEGYRSEFIEIRSSSFLREALFLAILRELEINTVAKD